MKNVAAPKKKIRYLVLFLVCMSLFSNGFIFDLPALLKEDILKTFTPIYGESKTNFYFSFLYSCYSIPNIILPLIGGFLSDIFGYRKMSLLFFLFIMLGQLVVYTGATQSNLKMMIFGRFLFGLGGESIGITSSVIMMKWFVGKELSFSNALNLSLMRSATVLNTILTPRIAERVGMAYAFGFGFALTLASFVSLLLLNMIDRNDDQNIKQKRARDEGIIDESDPAIDFQELRSQIFQDIRMFPRVFWIITLLMTTFYTSVLLFISFSSTVIIELWLPISDQDQELAGDLMSIPYMCCTFLSPPIGFLIDKYGQRIKIMIFACLLVFLGLTSILFIYPIFAMLLLGLAYALFGSTVWTSITYVVPSKHLGTAYGVMNSVQNCAFFLMPLFVAVISTEGSSQVSVVLFFIILSIISLVLAIHLYLDDHQRQVSLDNNDQQKLMDVLNTKEDPEIEEEIIKA